jgi:hypothetical protein
MRDGKPVLMVVGYGRAGKDTACEWFRDHTTLRFTGGSSLVAAPYMGKLLGLSTEEAFRRRHEDRMLWFNELNKLRADNPVCLVEMCLENSDIVCGPRNIVELDEARRRGLVDLICWIENPRVPADPTVEFSRADADIVIDNESDFATFYARLRRLSAVLKILR